MSTHHRLALVVVVAFATSSAPQVALAATDAAERSDPRHETETELEQVVVTASALRGTAEQLSDPVEVLRGEDLDEARAATLGETVGSLPGVQSSNFGPGVGRPIVRGLDGARVAVLAGGLATQDVSTVSQDHATSVEPFLADQIEVLKGPATLLYGSGAIGGVVNVVDGRIPEEAPAKATSGRAEIRWDSASEGHTRMLRVDGGNERFALHADAVLRDNDDYETPDGEQANSFLEARTGALGASVLGDWGFVGASVSRYDNEYGNPGEPGEPELGIPGVFLDIEQDRYEAKGGIQLPFDVLSELRFSAAHTDYGHIEFEGDEVGTEFIKDAREVRLELTHDPVAGWIGAVGLQASRAELEAIGEEAFLPRTRSRSAGLFVVERREWDAFQLDLGARVDDVQSDPDASTLDGAGRRDFAPVSVSVGGIWKAADGWDVVASFDRAERAPVEEELFSNGPHVATAAFEIGDPDLGEEAANQAEVGFHFHGGRVEAKASAYYNRFGDYIFLADTGEFAQGEDGEEPLPIRRWTQGDATFRGFEGEITVQLLENAGGAWEARLFGDTVRATFDDGGNVPRIAPSRLGGELRWSNGHWRASLGAVRYAKQDDVAANETPTGGYTLVDAHLAWHIDGANTAWELFLDGTNLTNEDARVHTSFLKDTVLLQGRSVSAGVRVFF